MTSKNDKIRAASSRLAPGEDSLERVIDSLGPRGPYAIDVRVRLWDGRLVRTKVRARTKGELRRKGRQKVEEKLASRQTEWKRGDPMTEFIDKVSRKTLESAPLRANTVARYTLGLDQLTEQFKGLTIADAVRFRTLEASLKAIARQHGSESARQARTVLSKYILDQLLREELIDHNPLRGVSIDLGAVNRAPTDVTEGRKALSELQYEQIRDHLLARDVSVPLPPGTDRRHTSILKHERIVAATLLQMATGLRLSEALALRWKDVTVSEDQIVVSVDAETSKTHRARAIPLLDERVEQYWRQRLDELKGESSLLLPAPGDKTKVWRTDNAVKAAAALYKDLGEVLEDPQIGLMRSHSWRTVLNARAISRGVSPEVRAAFFGHDKEMNARAYTDLTDVSSMSAALKVG